MLLTLATRMKPKLAFAAGSIAFTITSAIIVTIGSILTAILPVYWVKIGGGVIMICFATYEFFEITKEAKKIESEENAKLDRDRQKKNSRSILMSSIAMLVALDLAGDATEVLTIVFVAKFQDSLLVFLSCVAALILASGVETVIGHRIGKFLTPGRV
ncbi:MAG TPA: TMEM165/GDT1 family protein, partial [Nitrososphaerales archaeon]|nr:TMEM165/GDT1 family protein [Nitrososphaerales archaeon]